MWLGSCADFAQHGNPPSGWGRTCASVTGAGQSLPVSCPNMSHCSLSVQPVTESWVSHPAKSGSFGGSFATFACAAEAASASAPRSAHTNASHLAAAPPVSVVSRKLPALLPRTARAGDATSVRVAACRLPASAGRAAARARLVAGPGGRATRALVDLEVRAGPRMRDDRVGGRACLRQLHLARPRADRHVDAGRLLAVRVGLLVHEAGLEPAHEVAGVGLGHGVL